MRNQIAAAFLTLLLSIAILAALGACATVISRVADEIKHEPDVLRLLLKGEW